MTAAEIASNRRYLRRRAMREWVSLISKIAAFSICAFDYLLFLRMKGII